MPGRENLFLEGSGLSLRCHGEAGAPALVLVHGSGCDGSIWDELAERLVVAGLRVVAVDLPGHGGSPARAGADTLRIYADAVEEAIRALGLERPALGGHSLGGAVVLTLALGASDLADKLALIGTGARLRVMPAVIEAIRNDFDAAMASMGDFAFGPDAATGTKLAGQAIMRRNGQEALLADFLACDAFDAIAHLGKIQQLAIAICGEADALTPPKYSRFLAERMPHCRSRTLPGAGHMVMLEAPDALAEVLTEFLRG